MEQKVTIQGNIPAPVTPFDSEGRIQFEDFEKILLWHLDRGVDGICIAGDNGESWSLDAAERKALAETAVRTVNGRVPVIFGASATTAAQSIRYAEAVAPTGIDALMIGPQSYVMKATRKEIVSRMEKIHKAVPMPVVLYNSPRRNGIGLTLDDMSAIIDVIDVRALKEASRDFFYLSEVIHHFKDKFSVLVGPAPYIIPGIYLGAKGFISSGPELFPATSHVMKTALEPPTAETRALQHGYTRIYETLMGMGTWPSALKAAFEMIGVPAGVPREPLNPLGAEDSAKLKSVMKELGINV